MAKWKTSELSEHSADDVNQSQRLLVWLVGIYVPILLALVGVTFVCLQYQVPIRIFFADPVSVFDAPVYAGMFSNLGVLGWCATASVCLFTGCLVLSRSADRELPRFLVSAGLMTTALMLDDLFMLHEHVFPRHLHIPQRLVLLGYGGVVLMFLWRFKHLILASEYGLLVTAFGFFAASLLIDVFVNPEVIVLFGDLPAHHLFEDGFKLLGIASWFIYFVRTCRQSVMRLMQAI